MMPLRNSLCALAVVVFVGACQVQAAKSMATLIRGSRVGKVWQEKAAKKSAAVAKPLVELEAKYGVCGTMWRDVKGVLRNRSNAVWNLAKVMTISMCFGALWFSEEKSNTLGFSLVMLTVAGCAWKNSIDQRNAAIDQRNQQKLQWANLQQKNDELTAPSFADL
jgi:type IV pilus biogenesis protein CpaD/CtpE